jgi:hypothetical protein
MTRDHEKEFTATTKEAMLCYLTGVFCGALFTTPLAGIGVLIFLVWFLYEVRA